MGEGEEFVQSQLNRGMVKFGAESGVQLSIDDGANFVNVRLWETAESSHVGVCCLL